MESTSDVTGSWGSRLQQALSQAGLSQSRFAELIGKRAPTVNRWCSGVLLPTTKDQLKAVEILRNHGWAGTITGLFPRTVEEAELAAEAARRNQEGGQQ